MSHIWAKIPANNAVPSWIVFFIEFLLNICSNVLKKHSKEKQKLFKWLRENGQKKQIDICVEIQNNYVETATKRPLFVQIHTYVHSSRTTFISIGQVLAQAIIYV